MNPEKSVLTLVSCGADGGLSRDSLEILGAASILASCPGWRLMAAVSASTEARALQDLSAFGVKHVIRMEPSSETPMAANVAATLATITPRPGAFFLPDTLFGQEVAARTAALLESDLVRDCNFLSVDDEVVRLGRPYAGGRATLELAWSGVAPLVVTVAQGAFSPPVPSPPGVLEVEDAPRVAVADNRVRKLGELRPSPEALGLEEAQVLVAGGAGLGGPEGFELLRELAARLGGTIAASRVAVDRGWVPYDRQVGQTGKSVTPKLYLALGISGAPQHLAGIRGAEKVVAIDRDPHAPIFEVADLAVVADLWQVLPCLLQKLPDPYGKSAEVP